MNSFIVLFVFLMSFCNVVQDGMCSTFIIPNATHPDYPGQCFFNDTQLIILRKGQKKRYSKRCFYAECDEDYTFSGTGCGNVGVGAHCRVLKGDVSKPYPYCCDEHVC